MRDLVGEEDEPVQNVGVRRVDGIGSEDGKYKDERNDPCVLHGIPPELLEEALSFPPLREWFPPVFLMLGLFVSAEVWRNCRASNTLIWPCDSNGEGGLPSSVASDGAPVSPARISPPNPMDFRRSRGELDVPDCPSGDVDDKRGNASGVAAVMIN